MEHGGWKKRKKKRREGKNRGEVLGGNDDLCPAGRCKTGKCARVGELREMEVFCARVDILLASNMG